MFANYLISRLETVNKLQEEKSRRGLSQRMILDRDRQKGGGGNIFFFFLAGENGWKGRA